MSIARPLIACVLASLAPAPASAAPGGFLPDARALFAGCTASAEGSNGRFYACPGHSAGIVHIFATKEMDLQKAGAVMAAAVRTMVPKEVREETFSIELDGKTCSAVRLLPASRKASAAFGVAEAVVVPIKGGDFRGLWSACQRRSDRCEQQRREIFQYLAAKGPPERVTIDKPPEVGPPKLLGRTLQVPEGCQLAAANAVTGRIQCAGSMMSWNVLSVLPNLDKWLDEIAAQMEPALGGGVSKERLPCKIEGTAGKCLRLSKSRPEGVLLSYLGAAAIGDKGVMVGCTFPQSKSGFPAVCNHAITLE